MKILVQSNSCFCYLTGGFIHQFVRIGQCSASAGVYGIGNTAEGYLTTRHIIEYPLTLGWKYSNLAINAWMKR